MVFSLRPVLAASDLVEAAKKEGEVVLYSSLPVWANEKLCKAFEKEYGIKAGFYRAGSLKVLQKFLNEKSVGMVKADVFHNLYAAGFQTFKNDGYSVAYDSPEGSMYPDEFKDPDGHYYAIRLVAMCMAYNSDSIKKEDAPKSWEDMIDPKWKGMLVSADYMYGASQLATYYFWLDKFGIDFIEKLGQNNPMIVSSHGNAAKVMVSGERPIVIEMNSYDTWSKGQKGLPAVNVFPEEGVPFVPGYACVTADAPHPNAARLFLDFLLSEEGQMVMREIGVYSARKGMPPVPNKPPLDELNLVHTDWTNLEKNSQEIQAKISKALGRK
jgi:iron(III) transport system substrate-binding protein